MSITVVMPSLLERHDMRTRALTSVASQTWGMPQVKVVIGRYPWDARNEAIKAADTPWLAMLDDDDYWLPHHLATLMEKADGADLVYSRCVEQSPDGCFQERRFPPEFDPARLQQGNYIPTGYLVRREWAEAYPFPFRGPGDDPSDWRFLLSLMDAGARFAFTDTVTWVMTHHADNRFNWRDE